jgi:16S rRNA processing protein RimM
MVATFVSTSSTPTLKVTPESRQTQLRVGRLTKAHGLKGAIKVELYTDEPEKRFVPGAIFSVQVPEESPWYGKNMSSLTSLVQQSPLLSSRMFLTALQSLLSRPSFC